MVFGHEHFQRDDKSQMANMRSVTAAGTRRAIAALNSRKKAKADSRNLKEDSAAEGESAKKQQQEETTKAGTSAKREQGDETNVAGTTPIDNEAQDEQRRRLSSSASQRMDTSVVSSLSSSAPLNSRQEQGGSSVFSNFLSAGAALSSPSSTSQADEVSLNTTGLSSAVRSLQQQLQGTPAAVVGLAQLLPAYPSSALEQLIASPHVNQSSAAATLLLQPSLAQQERLRAQATSNALLLQAQVNLLQTMAHASNPLAGAPQNDQLSALLSPNFQIDPPKQPPTEQPSPLKEDRQQGEGGEGGTTGGLLPSGDAIFKNVASQQLQNSTAASLQNAADMLLRFSR